MLEIYREFRYKIAGKEFYRMGKPVKYFTVGKTNLVAMQTVYYGTICVPIENVTGLVPPNYSFEEWL